MLVDLILKANLDCVFVYGKLIIARLTKLKCSVTRFSLITHSLDIIYIQCLFWFFYLAPLLPLIVTIYCVIIRDKKLRYEKRPKYLSFKKKRTY